MLTTVYQVAPNLHLVKDLVFGWTVMGENFTLVLDAASLEQLQELHDIVPGTPMFIEAKGFLQGRIAKKKAQSLAKPAPKVIRLVCPDRQETLAKEEALRQEMARIAERMQDAMSIWFGQITPLSVYEVKNPQTGYVYCRVVPAKASYVLVDDRGIIRGEETTIADVVARILKRWW